jgi:hypothetical protein
LSEGDERCKEIESIRAIDMMVKRLVDCWIGWRLFMRLRVRLLMMLKQTVNDPSFYISACIAIYEKNNYKVLMI